MNFDKALESVKKVKLKGGIFGKTSLIVIVLCVCVTAVSMKVGTWWFALILMLPMMGLVFYSLKRVLDFAEKNPQAVIMDGAEFLVHEQIIHGIKGNQPIDTIITVDHQPSISSDSQASDQEDLPITPSLEQEGK
jgi:hypothetical protein